MTWLFDWTVVQSYEISDFLHFFFDDTINLPVSFIWNYLITVNKLVWQGFGKDPKVPTLIPKDPLRMKEMGQRLGLSYLDVKLANFMYQWDSHCAGASSCHSGFRDMNCKCRCPESHQGDYCEIVALNFPGNLVTKRHAR